MDPVADMLVAIKNGYLAKKVQILVPFSKFKYEIKSLKNHLNYCTAYRYRYRRCFFVSQTLL